MRNDSSSFSKACLIDNTADAKHFFIKSVQCWSNVEDVGPTLFKCYKNALCLLESISFAHIFCLNQ